MQTPKLSLPRFITAASLIKRKKIDANYKVDIKQMVILIFKLLLALDQQLRLTAVIVFYLAVTYVVLEWESITTTTYTWMEENLTKLLEWILIFQI